MGKTKVRLDAELNELLFKYISACVLVVKLSKQKKVALELWLSLCYFLV